MSPAWYFRLGVVLVSISVKKDQIMGNSINSFNRMSPLTSHQTSSSESVKMQRLSSVELSEVQDTIGAEPAFRDLKNQGSASFKQWGEKLTSTINHRLSSMPMDHNGIELNFRFRKAYSGVHHIAVGSVWRDSNRKLHFDVVHQESSPLPPMNGEKRGMPVGTIHNSFDTRKLFGGKEPPCLVSVDKEGPPDVIVRTCKNPHGLSEYTSHMERNYAFDGMHDYGYNGSQRIGEDGDINVGMTCFSISNTAHKVLDGELVTQDTSPTIPDMLKAVLDRISPNQGFDASKHFVDKSGSKQSLDEPPKDKNKQKAFYGEAFLNIGKNWGEKFSWDVNGQKERLPKF